MNNLQYDVENLPLDDQKTWDLICEGNTIGCFQIESRLGRQTCKRAAPRNIKELSDVIALIRPSCLEAKLEDGANIKDHYIKRKNGEEQASSIHPEIEDILKDTHMLLIYQEQFMAIAQKIAGFSLSEADSLRKAAGKKKVELMQSLRSKFVQGCLLKGTVNETDAETIFDWIEKSQRYSFCLAHSASYAYLSYATAYAKANDPIKFFRSYLSHSTDKQKPLIEVERLIEDARRNGIRVKSPDIRSFSKDFEITGSEISFGIGYVKGIGDAAYKQLAETVPDLETLSNSSWHTLLFSWLVNIKKTTVKCLLSCGAFDYLGESRKKMIYEYEIALSFNEKEVQYILDRLPNAELCSILQELAEEESGKGKVFHNVRRQQTARNLSNSFQNPPFSLKDTIEQMALWEESFLGKSLTCSKFDVIDRKFTDEYCEDFESTNKKQFTVVGQVTRIFEIITKDGKDMAFGCIADNTGEMEDIVIFSDPWEKYRNLLSRMQILRFTGHKGEDGEAFILTKCEEII